VHGDEAILEPEARARYAEAIVDAGVVVRRGDLVVADGEPAHRELLLAIAEAAYRRGARHVQVEMIDPLVAAARFRHGSRNAIGVRPPWTTARNRALMQPDGARIHVAGESEPGAFDGIDPRLLADDDAQVRKQQRAFVKATLDGRVRWTIAAWPTEPWATRVYPDEQRLEAQRLLARDLLWFCRVSAEDGEGTAAWVEHVRTLESRCKKLGRLKLERLELRGPGTELGVGIAPQSIWLGGREKTVSGRRTSPNMPTEEVFTSPAPAATDGTFRCSRPLNFQSRMIEGIAGEFRGGRLVRLEAAREDDRELLAAFLDADGGARRLGEVALVDASSRVGRASRTYFNTLLDENAAAHIAFGAGFPNTRERGARRVNDSVLHLDVMIGTDEFEVTGVAARGRRVALIAGGEWQI
jgi:aminopeptidase